ncbi:hypothetical protein L484_002970 [Morus notabilis]|uniref:Uncharacterized protein n=1 Tax=Morus notabilis TaxID=981085 RepID=W9R301_9ROSA|nr:hypothetical protein L484_002970 [Morus notabilis]
MGPVTTPKVVAVPVPVVDREERFDLTADGPVTTPKFLTLPGAVVGREESFDLTNEGPRFDNKRCHLSRASCRS